VTRDQFDGNAVTRMIEEAKAQAWTDGYVAGLEYAQRVIAGCIPESVRPETEPVKTNA
jgi:hypothetical protein